MKVVQLGARFINEKFKHDNDLIYFGDGKMKEKIGEVKKLLDWLHSRELTWAVLIFTCFIGLIELLPEIKYYGPSIGERLLTFLLALVGLTLIGGFIFSIDRYIRLANMEGVLELKLPKTMRNRLFGTMGPFHGIFFQLDKDGNFLYVKRWVVPLTSFVFAVIWTAIIILKIT